MRIVITGATGYIGGRLLARVLDQGSTASCVVHARDPAKLPQGVQRIIDPGSATALAREFAEASVDVVLHLAASQHLTDDASASDSLVEANIAFGARVLSAAHVSGAKGVVLAGTFSTHALGGPEYVPQTLYAATKQALGDLAVYYNRSTPLRVVTLELSDNYGPGDPRTKFVSLLADSARTGRALDATPGEQIIRPLHVDDVVGAFVQAARLMAAGSPLAETYSVAGSEAVTLCELAACFARATGTRPTVRWGRRTYRPNEIMLPYVGESLPGWQPAYALEEGLAEVFGRKVSD